MSEEKKSDKFELDDEAIKSAAGGAGGVAPLTAVYVCSNCGAGQRRSLVYKQSSYPPCSCGAGKWKYQGTQNF